MNLTNQGSVVGVNLSQLGTDISQWGNELMAASENGFGDVE
jgi:hypothetical protein